MKKKISHRVLSRLDVKIIEFLWKWKLANVMTLLYAVAPERSFWRFYRKLRRLYYEGYIKEVSDSKSSIIMWTLTKKGFQYINDGSMELVQKRFQPQALAHDYWAMAFHLGNFILKKPKNAELVTEQEFTAKDIADLPKWVPKTKEHIPDGFTKIATALGHEVIAFEVELSVKSDSRYEEMIRYLDQKEEITWILWLCANEKIIEKITQKIVAVRRIRPMSHHFVLTKDVQKNGWSAIFLWGQMVGKTVQDLIQSPPTSPVSHLVVTSTSPDTMNIYFSSTQSPKKFKGLGASVDPLKLLTP